MVRLSSGERDFIWSGISQDLRSDGRKRLTYRSLFVQTGVIAEANGSARVKIGATDVISSVKAELGKPTPLLPDKGRVVIHVDCSPTSSPLFEGRGGDEVSSELSLALKGCLLGSKSGAGAGIDLSSLAIVAGKMCWDLYIDCLVLASDGNILDTLAASIKAALSNTGIPKVNIHGVGGEEEEPEVELSEEEMLQFDTTAVPVIVTLTSMGGRYVVDASGEEESEMGTAVSISVNREGKVCGVSKRGGSGLDPSVILDMVSVANHVGQQLIAELDSQISVALDVDHS